MARYKGKLLPVDIMVRVAGSVLIRTRAISFYLTVQPGHSSAASTSCEYYCHINIDT